MATDTHDIIFAGGGTTACVTAGRLAQIDPSMRILVLEVGPHTREMPEYTQPGRFFRNILLKPKAFFHHIARPSDALAGRSLVVSSGRAVGGGSSVNFTTYTRAAASDYDDWERIYGNKGWGSEDLIPLLKKAETYEGPTDNDTHGTSGPIKISLANSDANVGEEFLNVAAAFDTARPSVTDLNDFHTSNGYGKWARFIDGKSGRRSDAAHHYIYNQIINDNLKVLARQRVVRVLFEGNRAVGVEYVSEKDRGTDILQTQVARASKLVVLSAGAFGSPAILERSGIGAANILKENAIAQLVDLPGVGQNYMDHNLLNVPYFASDEADTLDIISRGSEAELRPYIKQWTEHGTGLLANNALDAGIKLRPTTEDDFKELGPEFEHRWKAYFAEQSDKPVIVLAPFAAYTGMNAAASLRKYIGMEYWTAYPIARGQVHITSGLDPFGKLDLNLGFLEDSADLTVLRWAYKVSRELVRRMCFYRGEFDLAHPAFPDGSQATCKPADGPIPLDTPRIVYTSEDDECIDQYHRSMVETTWHSSGTCSMKPLSAGGVVDAKLNVYGVRHLKVDDLSIIPSNVGANTYNTALAIGEKAALIIADELGIETSI